MREFVQYLIETIAKNPEEVTVEEKQLDETYIREEITVHPDDMGLVIGRNGRTIQSVRELAKAKAIKQGVKVDVELLEPDRPAKPGEETEEKEEQTVIDQVEAEVEAMASELEEAIEDSEEEEELLE